MNRLVSKIRTGAPLKQTLKPKSGFSHFIHLLFTLLLPTLVYIFVRLHFVGLALGIILLSKWRMFAVRPRHWWPNIRANAVDIIVGISMLVFITESDLAFGAGAAMQMVWTAVYLLWLLLLKPRSGTFMVALQALACQTAGLMALWLAWGDKPSAVLVLGTGIICYVSARHFFSNFDEPYSALFSHTWGYFAAALSWILAHWLLFYGVLAQPTLILSVLGFGLGALYYLEQRDRLSLLLRRQFVFIMIAIVVVVLVFSDWGPKTI